MVSACGLTCTGCQFYKNPCNGCYEVKGKTFWAEELMPNKICILYNCSINEKEYKKCGNCKELPCKKFKELKDPNITEEEHIKSIKERVDLLKSL